MRVGTELDRLALVRPQIMQRTEDVVDAAEENRMLHRIITTAVPVPDRAGSPGRAGSAGRRRRAGLVAGGLGLTAAGVAAVIVVASIGAAVPGGPAPVGHHGQAGRSARQMLLAAAATAEARPESSGTYWYVKQSWSPAGLGGTEETWTVRNGGTTWLWAGKKTHDRLIKQHLLPRPGWSLLLGSSTLVPFRLPIPAKHTPRSHLSSWAWLGLVSFGQLQGLPTNPAALKARIIALTRSSGISEPVAVFESLINLVTGLPAPPQVRAAAFRALATLPIVTTVRTVHGGVGLRISTGRFGGFQHSTLVVDPATSQVRIVFSAGGNRTSVTAHWVNWIPQRRSS